MLSYIKKIILRFIRKNNKCNSIECFTAFMDKELFANSEADFESILNDFVNQGKIS